MAAIPVPDRLATAEGALEFTVRNAPRPPSVSGVKVTLIAQLAPGDSEEPQLLV